VSLQRPPRLHAAQLREAAIGVLERNWTSAGTLPSPTQYPHQWSWDSAFIAIGWAHVDPSRARAELAALFEGQWSDGRLPHIQFSPAVDEDAYFPGPRFWNSAAHPSAAAVATSGLIQPPVHARAVLIVGDTAPDSESTRRFLADLYPRLAAWHAYLLDRRVLNDSGLVAIVHPWESGMDNSPLWDAALAHSPSTSVPRFTRRDTAHVNPAERPADRDYERYVGIAARYRDLGYDDAALPGFPFLVEDPLINAVLLDAEICLGHIAARLGHNPAPHQAAARRLSDALHTSLWNETLGRFAARDLVTGAHLTEPTVGTLVPLLDPWLPDERRRRLLTLARSPQFAGGCAYPLPTTAVTAATFDRRRYWRGPMWANTNWLVHLGARQSADSALAATITEATLAAVGKSGFREYYDPVTGDGLGAHDFSWTAALTIDWLAHLDAGGAEPAAQPPEPRAACQ
jgi:hypothetical protein